MQKGINMTLLSRRSFFRAGTRYNSRGVDEQGKVANFVESETIVSFNQKQYVFSHLQIRGSVPLFWTQKAKKQSKVSFKDSKSKNKLAFDTHFDELLRKYSRVYVLNLLSGQDKQDEVKISQAMLNLLEERNDPNIGFYSFDFHDRIQGGNYAEIGGLMNVLRPVIMDKNQRFFIHVRDKGNTYYQGGVVRTNCLDCLDRTNYTQAHISDMSVKSILEHISRAKDTGGSEG